MDQTDLISNIETLLLKNRERLRVASDIESESIVSDICSFMYKKYGHLFEFDVHESTREDCAYVLKQSSFWNKKAK